MNLRNSFLLLLAGVFLTGCSTTITNLTPSNLPRNSNNLYPFEVALETTQASIHSESIKPYVMMGQEIYPMEPVQLLKNRWEALVPVPANTNYVYYRYKFDYAYDRIPKPANSSRLSTTYKLEIVDK
jgi:hypothetical protein